jgi:hydroxymethylpyrimidine pyrophosphatase-like HAD family hydrolase
MVSHMRYQALICDYDGTLAENGVVSDATIASLESVVSSGRKLLMATGRRLEELLSIFSRADLFELVVAENGALIYAPRTRREVLLADSPPQKVYDELVSRGVTPVVSGKVIIATREPYETAALEVIRELGLELQVIFNKGAVMILPEGVNKASGMLAALQELGISRHNAVGIGDAENDHSFLSRCEFSAAVSNALESVQGRVDIVMASDHGRGVNELIERLIATDLREFDERVYRRHVLLGRKPDGTEVRVPPFGSRLLIAGPSGSGKSTVVTAVLEHLAKAEYQYCVIDPEGDHQNLQHAVVVGDAKSAPGMESVNQLLDQFSNPVISLVGVAPSDRPAFGEPLLRKIVETQSEKGRPHWVVLDEAHHLLPASSLGRPRPLRDAISSILITVHPGQVSTDVLEDVNLVIAVGDSPQETFAEFSRQAGLAEPVVLREGDANVHFWRCKDSKEAFPLRVELSKRDSRRHKRKYAEGDLKDRSFRFRGPDAKLNLKAQNLIIFVQLAEGVDDETWLYHLRRKEYSQWIKTAIKDEALAEKVAAVEEAEMPPAESRSQIKTAIEELYTEPAKGT